MANGETAPSPRSHLILQQSGLAKANLLLMYNKGLSPDTRTPLGMVNFPGGPPGGKPAEQNRAGWPLDTEARPAKEPTPRPPRFASEERSVPIEYSARD
jgi:hypothetical protein